jgi:thiamine biosynthesis lipoprotein
MGSYGHLIVVGGPEGLADRGVERLDLLESRWSRFRSNSELSQLNAAGGEPMLVSADTVVLIDALRRAWQLTAGRFDPTVLDAMCDLGYAASWPDVASPLWLPKPHPTPGCGGVDLHAERGLVQLPPGVHLDPGGLGKGLAADLVATELAEAAEGVLVNVGGDLRVMGRPPEGAAWVVGIEHPDPGMGDLARLELADGGVATSTSARRRWESADGTPLHHLVDPRTGRPAERQWRQVTTISATAWWAEVLAIVAFLDGELGDDSAAALVIDADGGTRTLGDPRWFAVDPEPVR